MIATHREVLSTLNRLIAVCKDGEQGFRTAAHDVDNLELRELFHHCAEERARFAASLEDTVRIRGARPTRHGTLAGAIRRSWMNLLPTSAVNESAILRICDRADEAALKAYENAMQMGLPTDLNELVESQYSEIHREHNAVLALAAGSGH
jgi:uncharacterized protein (TIGR02284 family)